jgi:hypothetical protein
MLCLIPVSQIPGDVSAGWSNFMQWPPIFSTSSLLSLTYKSVYRFICTEHKVPHSSRILSPDYVLFVSHHTSGAQIWRRLLYFFENMMTPVLGDAYRHNRLCSACALSVLDADTDVVFTRYTIICWFYKMEHKNGFYQLLKFLLPPAVNNRRPRIIGHSSAYYTRQGLRLWTGRIRKSAAAEPLRNLKLFT